MSESTISVLIAVGILIVLALFVPCMESLAKFLRRNASKRSADEAQQKDQTYKRNVA